MATVDEIRGALRAARAERDEVKARLESLEETVAALEAAEEAIGGASGAAMSGRTEAARARKQRAKKSAAKKSTAKRSTAKASGRKPSKKAAGARRGRIGPDELIDAVVALGGEATTDQLKEHLGITDGRLIAGARTSASSQGRLMVDGGLLRVADKGRVEPGPSAAGG